MRDIGRDVVGTLCLMAVATGCGGDGGGGDGDEPGDPATTAEVAERCQTFDDHATACGWGGNVNGYDWNCGEAGLVWRADAFRAFAQCAIALACDGVGQSCLVAATNAVEPIAVHDTYAARCSTRTGECGLPALLCGVDRYELYTDAFVEQVVACFDRACGEIVTCLEQGG